MRYLILFGPPGVGKGTQCELLVQKYGFVHISTGELYRKEIAAQTTIGQEADRLIKQGYLCPDEMSFQLLQQEMAKHPDAKGFLFDGFPRTVAQAQMLDAMMRTNNERIEGVIALTADNDELIKRITERAKTSGRNEDADPVAVRKRLAVYHETTAPVMQYYDTQGKLFVMDGVGHIPAIHEAVCVLVDEMHKVTS